MDHLEILEAVMGMCVGMCLLVTALIIAASIDGWLQDRHFDKLWAAQERAREEAQRKERAKQ